MDTSVQVEEKILKTLHLEALPQKTRKAFLTCAKNSFFQKGHWYLAGGTALALHTGHRKSVDLDFFTTNKTFKVQDVEKKMNMLGAWETTSKSEGTLYGELEGAKISLIAYPFFSPGKMPSIIGSVSVLTPPDIAAMKIVAVSQRGKKRDFFDLYWLSLHVQPLIESILAAQEQYTVKQNFTHVLKALVYFNDAENDPDPEIYFKADWKQVKKFFRTEVLIITKKLLKIS